MANQDKGEGAMTYVIIGLIVAAIVGLATPIITKKPDTPVEQAAEMYIYSKTGKQVDFSPDEKPDTVNQEIVK